MTQSGPYDSRQGDPTYLLSLDVPSWVPPPIATLAQSLYAESMLRPAEFFGQHVESVRRVTTDNRMRRVWLELYKRRGGAKHAGDFVHATDQTRIRSFRYFRCVEHISSELNERERTQNQAAVILFLVATGNALWDRNFDVGPRTRTKRELEDVIATFRQLADSHENDAGKYERLGDWRASRTLRNLAVEARQQADVRSPVPQNVWTVERKSNRVGDDWDRGLIIDLVRSCLILFGEKLHGTVAIVSNVVLGRQDITASTVQGIAKHISAPKKPRPSA